MHAGTAPEPGGLGPRLQEETSERQNGQAGSSALYTTPMPPPPPTYQCQTGLAWTSRRHDHGDGIQEARLSVKRSTGILDTTEKMYSGTTRGA
jgi:hypothetical protein